MTQDRDPAPRDQPGHGDAPWHAHVYVPDGQRDAAAALRATFLRAASGAAPPILFVGQLTAGKAGPHPIPQFEVHVLARSVPGIVAAVEASGLRALLHPLTDDDLADHTTSARWIGPPLALDLATLDPPGRNRGVARFGRSDF